MILWKKKLITAVRKWPWSRNLGRAFVLDIKRSKNPIVSYGEIPNPVFQKAEKKFIAGKLSSGCLVISEESEKFLDKDSFVIYRTFQGTIIVRPSKAFRRKKDKKT